MRFRFFLTVVLLSFFPGSASGSPVVSTNQLIDAADNKYQRKEYARSLELYAEAEIVARQNNLEEQLMRIYFGMGNNYLNLYDNGEALSMYQEAYKYALSTGDTRYETFILSDIAYVYSNVQDYAKAEEYMLRSYNVALTNGDPLVIARSAFNLSTLYSSDIGDIDKGDEYLDITFAMLESSPNEQMRIYANINQIALFTYRGQYKEAEERAFEMLEQWGDRDNPEFLEHVYSILAQVYHDTGKHDLAIQYAKLAIDNQPAYGKSIFLYQMISDSYYQDNNFEQAMAYRDSVVVATNEMTIQKEGRNLEVSRIKMELSNYQRELAENIHKRKIERLILIGVVLLFIIMMGVLYLFFKQLKQKRKIAELELRDEKNEKLLLEKQMTEKEALALLEQEKLSNEIDKKNRELTSNAMLNSSRNEMLEEIVNSILSDPVMAKYGSLRSHILKIKNQIKADNDNDNFLIHFEQVNSDFIKGLNKRHPNLSASDIKFLSYIYMNLSTKEIASILNITPESCKKKRARIRNKLKLDNTTNLYTYLSSL